MGIFIGFFSVTALQKAGKKEAMDARRLMLEEKKEKLKNIVENAVSIIENSDSRDEAVKIINIIRYGNNNYLWINSTDKPFPKMIMHPISPQLNGKVMDNPKFDCAMGKNQNLFAAMVEVAADGGDGYVDYKWAKSGQGEKLFPKLSYVKEIKKYDWIIGTGIYIDDIDEAIAAKADSINSNINRQVIKIISFTILLLIVMACLSIFLATKFTGLLLNMIRAIKVIGEGDLTTRLSVATRDEIGQLGVRFNEFVEKLHSMVRGISDTANNLSSSSDELSSVSAEMASSAEEMNAQSNTVAKASEQVSSVLDTVAASAEQSSVSVSSIAAMTEEMSSTISNIAGTSNRTAENVRQMADISESISSGISMVADAAQKMISSLGKVVTNASHASHKSRKADETADAIKDKMDGLVTASKQIGKVVGVIKDIADQTNMLALNATIEAAGAGEAGKGFAVVAGEVKELSRQSADASDEIAGQVEKIQNSTDIMVRAISEITGIISETAEINQAIASEVKEQSEIAGKISQSIVHNAVTAKEVAEKANGPAKLVDEIARSTDEASKVSLEVAKHVEELSNGVKEVARSTVEGANAVKEISHNIAGLSSASRETAIGAGQTRESSKELARMASSLSEIVSQFKLSSQLNL